MYKPAVSDYVCKQLWMGHYGEVTCDHNHKSSNCCVAVTCMHGYKITHFVNVVCQNYSSKVCNVGKDLGGWQYHLPWIKTIFVQELDTCDRSMFKWYPALLGDCAGSHMW